MRNAFLYLSLFCYSVSGFSQQKMDNTAFVSSDSLSAQYLDEIIVIGNPNVNYKRENKALGSLDSYLGKSNLVNMIKRGAYAWEPMLNGMATERSILTIDGMRIFNACTDKMDPITSYVENTNLSRAKISEGQQGAQFGGTIAGSIDLQRRKSGFEDRRKMSGSLFSGFESNNKQKIFGAGLNYSSPKLFGDIDFTLRDAENYKAGERKELISEVDFSQFNKYNLSAIAGYKVKQNHEIEASLIYDRATDVGYPGLPMDVSLAEALIVSLEYRQRNISEYINLLESKIYLNTITHIMDDSHRPVVPIRMDMPGWSKTMGFYSKISGNYNQHNLKGTLSGYINNSLAEMTMYPDNPNEKEMFMLTWPDVNTYYGGVNLEDNIIINSHMSLWITGGLGVQNNQVKSELGLSSLRLFYPDLKAAKTRTIKSLSSQLFYHNGNFLHSLGLGYGDRAPTVSEGYGFYLLNVNDNYDYVGNPYLKNEKSLNFNASTTFEIEKFEAKAKINYFYVMDYILGKPREGFSPMNITANGIKVYEQLSDASIFNSSIALEYRIFKPWVLGADASYRYGQGADNTILPLIQPFSYRNYARFSKNSFFAEISVEGSSKNRNSVEFGESQKPAYAILNSAFSKEFEFNDTSLILKLGGENLLDKYYSTFDDWFGIPRMGRNIYVNVVFKLL